MSSSLPQDHEYKTNLTFYLNGKVQTVDQSTCKDTDYTTLLQYLRTNKKVRWFFCKIYFKSFFCTYFDFVSFETFNSPADRNEVRMW